MQAAARDERFEDAARYRNRLFAVQHLVERQAVERQSVGTADVIGFAADGDRAVVQIFPLRGGKMVDRHSFHLENVGGQDVTTVLESFGLEYYGNAPSVPPQIVVPRDAGDLSALAELLSERRGSKVEVRIAERGEKRRLQQLADENALHALRTDVAQGEQRRLRRVEALEELREALNLESLPLRIECYDISHAMGQDTGRVDGRLPGRAAAQVRLPQVRDQDRGRRPGRLRGDGRGDLAPVRAPFGWDGRDARRLVRGRAEPRRHRRRQGPALGGARRRPGVRPAARGRDRAREAGRGGVRAGPLRPDPPRPALAGPPAAAADPRRGAPVRARLPPAAARSSAASARSSTSSRASARRGGGRCSQHFGSVEAMLAAAPGGARGRARACRRRPPGASTRSCTRPAARNPPADRNSSVATSRGEARPVGATGPAAALRLIGSRNFGPYFVGNAASASGTWFQNLAAALLIYRLTHSAFLLGVLNFSNFVPVLLLAPWAGSAADRFDRRRLLLGRSSSRPASSGMLAALAWAGLRPGLGRARLRARARRDERVQRAGVAGPDRRARAARRPRLGGRPQLDDVQSRAGDRAGPRGGLRARRSAFPASFAINSGSYLLLVARAPARQAGAAAACEPGGDAAAREPEARARPAGAARVPADRERGRASRPTRSTPRRRRSRTRSAARTRRPGYIIGAFGVGAVLAAFLLAGRAAGSRRRMLLTLGLLVGGMVAFSLTPWLSARVRASSRSPGSATWARTRRRRAGSSSASPSTSAAGSWRSGASRSSGSARSRASPTARSRARSASGPRASCSSLPRAFSSGGRGAILSCSSGDAILTRL